MYASRRPSAFATVLTVLLLALGGTLVVAAPASAAEPLTVLSPAEGSTTDTRNLTFSGRGAPGAVITITREPGGTPVGDDGEHSGTVTEAGAWTITDLGYTDAAAALQRVVVTQLVDGVTESVAVTFSLPVRETDAPAQPAAILITSPANGVTLGATALVVEGTAPAGSLLRYNDPVGGDYLSELTVDAAGTFRLEFRLSRSAHRVPVTIEFTGTRADGTELAPASVTVFAAPLFDAPVITSPRSGTTQSGTTLQFSGTGVPGRQLVVSIYVPELPLGQFELYSRVSGEVTVSAAGNWAVGFTDVRPATYTAFASLVELFPGGGAVESEFSDEITVTLAAATQATSARPTAQTTRAELANTGISAGGAVSFGALLLLAGAAIGVARARREAATR
ncbi:MAG: hypothetical protein JWM51_465 [Microbacteriaceae bacterium]|nr:hypothetical protein [Microbacteriaceae bacterium]